MTSLGCVMTRWKDCDLEVRAEFVPRYCWMTASIDVYLDDLCILRTGGVLRIEGAQTKTFRHETEDHVLELSWRPARLVSFPYQLSIDGRPIITATVCPRNWPLVIIPLAAMTLIPAAAITLILIAFHVPITW
jgi:hypothetical protein